MRDIFEEIFAKDPLDAMEAARRSMRPTLRRRFYEKAMVEGGPEGFAVLLDGKPVRTPARRLLAAPSPAVAEEIAQYLGSDLLFYRAEGPQALVERQARQWDPVLAWARDTLGARFVLAAGVMFVEQPEGAMAAAKAAIPADAWRLGAVSSITSLTGSALLALAMLRGRLSVDEAWAAAHVD